MDIHQTGEIAAFFLAAGFVFRSMTSMMLIEGGLATLIAGLCCSDTR
jgi:hypothetical protein